MNDLKNVKVGDTLYVQPQRARNRDSEWPEPETVLVTKVGRRWITTESDTGWRETRYDRDTAMSESTHNEFANGYGQWAFATDEERADFVADVIESEWIKKVIDRGFNRWRNWDLEGLRCLAQLCESQNR